MRYFVPVEGCAEARYHEDPLSPLRPCPPLPPSDPFSALLPTSTFHPATPRCLRGDRANSTDHRAFLASLASTRCNPFSPPLLRNPVLEARAGRQPMRSVAGEQTHFFRDISFLSLSLTFLPWRNVFPRQRYSIRYRIRVTLDRLRHGRQVERHRNRERLTNVSRVIDSGN